VRMSHMSQRRCMDHRGERPADTAKHYVWALNIIGIRVGLIS